MRDKFAFYNEAFVNQSMFLLKDKANSYVEQFTKFTQSQSNLLTELQMLWVDTKELFTKAKKRSKEANKEEYHEITNEVGGYA